MEIQGSNGLIAALPSADRAALRTQLVAVAIPKRTVLYKSRELPHYAYFITSGVASVVVSTLEGQTAEVSLIGREGVTGIFQLLGDLPSNTHCFVQVDATALRIPFQALQKEMARSETLRSLLLAFARSQNILLEQLCGCNLFHEADARLARWLLMAQDRLHSDQINLTQEFLGEMLGSGRPTVTLACGLLQKNGAIEYHRGSIRILDRSKLREAACECYAVAEEAFRALQNSMGAATIP